MAKKASNNPTPISSQPALIFPVLPPEREGDEIIPLHQLARIVAALPPHRVIRLSEAFDQVRNLLGGELAARDLMKHAQAGHLRLAAWGVEPGGIEQIAILRPAFWQHYRIQSTLPDVNGLERVGMRGPQRPGRWYFFVSRRRFDRLYSIPAPGKPVAQRASPKQSQPQDDPPTTKSRPLKKLPAEKWLMARFDSKPRPGGMDQETYLKEIHDDMQKDPTVRRVCKYKTVQNRYANWLSSPKRFK